jgi:hypothetical protein
MRARVRASSPHWSTVLLAALPLALAAFALLLQVLSPETRSVLCTPVVTAACVQPRPTLTLVPIPTPPVP